MSLDKFLLKPKRKLNSNSDEDDKVEKKQKIDEKDLKSADKTQFVSLDRHKNNSASADTSNIPLTNEDDKVDKKPKLEEKDKSDFKSADKTIILTSDQQENKTSADTSHIPLTKTIVDKSCLKWRKLKAENLDCDYVQLYTAKEANELLAQCEKELVYNTGQLSQVQIFGRWHNIPRKQTAHGDSGLSYTFSGKTVPAKPWVPLLTGIRDTISQVTGHDFNFVLVNRYKDGHDHIGEHKDDEKDLVSGHPIASLSLGQPRDFVFKHQAARGKNATRKIALVKIELQNGGLLMMNHPTNSYWYHSLPQRKNLHGVRINMTFRKMVVGRKK